MKATTKSYIAKTDQTIVVIDKSTNEGIVCAESDLAEALRELNPDASQEIEDAISEFAEAYSRNECIGDYLAYFNVSIDTLPEEAVTYEYELEGSYYGGETYESIRNRIAALWGFDSSDIDFIDWIEEYTIIDGNMHIGTPQAVDYVIKTEGGREVSYATNFVRNYLTC